MIFWAHWTYLLVWLQGMSSFSTELVFAIRVKVKNGIAIYICHHHFIPFILFIKLYEKLTKLNIWILGWQCCSACQLVEKYFKVKIFYNFKIWWLISCVVGKRFFIQQKKHLNIKSFCIWIVYLVLYIFTVVNIKEGPTIPNNASYSPGSCHLILVLPVLINHCWVRWKPSKETSISEMGTCDILFPIASSVI